MRTLISVITFLLLFSFVLCFEGCRQKQDIVSIQQKLEEFDDVDAFVT